MILTILLIVYLIGLFSTLYYGYVLNKRGRILNIFNITVVLSFLSWFGFWVLWMVYSTSTKKEEKGFTLTPDEYIHDSDDNESTNIFNIL
jgi:hypothetical protein